MLLICLCVYYFKLNPLFSYCLIPLMRFNLFPKSSMSQNKLPSLWVLTPSCELILYFARPICGFIVNCFVIVFLICLSKVCLRLMRVKFNRPTGVMCRRNAVEGFVIVEFFTWLGCIVAGFLRFPGRALLYPGIYPRLSLWNSRYISPRACLAFLLRSI